VALPNRKREENEKERERERIKDSHTPMRHEFFSY